MRLLRQVKKDAQWLLLAGIFFLFFVLKLPSFFEPYWYGDEGIYEVIGFALRHGRMLYSGIWDNKPPLLYLIYALFNGDQPSVRFFSFLIGLLTIFSFFLLSKKLFKSKTLIYILTALLAIFLALPILEGNIANAENFMLFPITLAGYFVIRNFDLSLRNTGKGLFIPGFLLGLAFLIKIVAIFDFTAFFLFVFFVTYKNTAIKSLIKQILSLVPFIVGFSLPIFITVGYFFFLGQLSTFIHSAFINNIGYVGYGNQLEFASGILKIPQGLLVIKLFLLADICLYIFLKRRSFSISQLFILLWTPFAVFNMLFSQRSYTHYALVLLPSLLLFGGLAKEETRKQVKKIISVAFAIIVCITIFMFYLYKGLPHKTVDYYVNFFTFLTHQKSTDKYYAFFDTNTPNDYALSEFINANKKPENTLFLWGNNAQVYKLTDTLPPGRYIVAYHITGVPKAQEETDAAVKKVKPTFVLISQKMSSIPFSLEEYKMTYTIGNTLIYEKLP